MWLTQRIRWVVIFTTAALIGGCSLLKGMPEQRPEAQVQSVEVQQVDEDGIDLQVQVQLTNPADRAVPINDVVYDLMIGGRQVMQGRAAMSVRLEPGQTASQSFTVPVSWEALQEATAAADLSGGTVAYVVDGRMVLPDVPFIESTPVRFEGEFDVQRLVRQAIQSGAGLDVPGLGQLASRLGLMPSGGLVPEDVPLLSE
jgi:LEA14-like dessication related protein